MATNPWLSDASARAAADAVCASVNGGTIQVRSGTQPANANTAATGTLLVTLSFAATAFGAVHWGRGGHSQCHRLSQRCGRWHGHLV